MACNCCGKRLNIGMIQKIDPNTGQKFKSCPHCSDANGGEHVYHPYPHSFGKTPARKTAKNPDGYQSYCADCRRLEKGVTSKSYQLGRRCSDLI
ncbi:hypothetical protein [Photobacterium leiognathi]|uniref:hypothetical protein n=1 Tax=Photobacterium leiognathi TaxID=553611 RepID=UPI002981ED7B|nr:hypothetical protein [Photobacterium leiognathi]